MKRERSVIMRVSKDFDSQIRKVMNRYDIKTTNEATKFLLNRNKGYNEIFKI